MDITGECLGGPCPDAERPRACRESLWLGQAIHRTIARSAADQRDCYGRIVPSPSPRRSGGSFPGGNGSGAGFNVNHGRSQSIGFDRDRDSSQPLGPAPSPERTGLPQDIALRRLTLFFQSLYTQACGTGVAAGQFLSRLCCHRRFRKVIVSPAETKDSTTKESATKDSATKREIVVEIPVEDVNRQTDSLIQKYQKVARIPGFRRGHVPASIIRQRFSEEIKTDMVEALIPQFFRREAERLSLHL